MQEGLRQQKESEKKKAASEGKETEDSRWSWTSDHHTCADNENFGLSAASVFLTSSVFLRCLSFGVTFTADAAGTLPVAVVPAGPHSRDEAVEETHHVLWRTQSCGVLLNTHNTHVRFWEKTHEEESLGV